MIQFKDHLELLHGGFMDHQRIDAVETKSGKARAKPKAKEPQSSEQMIDMESSSKSLNVNVVTNFKCSVVSWQATFPKIVCRLVTNRFAYRGIHRHPSPLFFSDKRIEIPIKTQLTNHRHNAR